MRGRRFASAPAAAGLATRFATCWLAASASSPASCLGDAALLRRANVLGLACVLASAAAAVAGGVTAAGGVAAVAAAGGRIERGSMRLRFPGCVCVCTVSAASSPICAAAVPAL